VLRTLESYGLKRVDAEVYIFLAKKGPQKGIDIAGALKIRKRQLYSILEALQDKGVVTVSAVFSLSL
jgi:sugar-specific transcriptional regulator TrmB